MFVRISLTPYFILGFSFSVDAQTALNNAALQAIPSTQYEFVARLGFAAPGDGGFSLYHSSKAPCSINNGAGDNGSQVTSADNKCWIANLSGVPSIKVWGAKCDSNGTPGNGTNDSAVFAAANAAGVGFTISEKCRIADNIELEVPMVIRPTGQIVVDTGKRVTASGNNIIHSLTPFPDGGVVANNVSIARSNTITENPVGNSPQSLSSLSVTASTSDSPKPIQRQYTTQLGTFSNTGHGWGGYYRGANVTRYTGIVCQHGTGWCWADNPLITLDPATGDYSGISSELDINNNGFPVPNTGTVSDDIEPWAIGEFILGVGDYTNSVGLEIAGLPYTWNNGLAITRNSVRNTAVFDSTNADVGYRVLGAHTASIDTTSMAPGSVRIEQSSILPGVCTSPPSVTFSGGGLAAATAYLGLQNSSTIATGGSGYMVGDKVAFATAKGVNVVTLDNIPLASVTSVNPSGAVTDFTFTLKTFPGISSHISTVNAEDTSMTVINGAIYAPGDMIRIWLDTLSDSMNAIDVVYVYVTAVNGNVVSFAPPLSQVVLHNNASYSGPIQSSMNAEVFDFGVRASPGASVAALAGPLSQTATSGSGTGFTLNPVWGVSTIFMTSYGGGYATAPTVTIDSAHVACSVQPTATAVLGGYPMKVGNSSWLVGQNVAKNADLRMIATDIYDRVVIGYDGNTNVQNGLSVGAQNLTMSQGEFGLSKIAASGTAPGPSGVKLEAVCGSTAGTAKIIAYAGTSATPVTIVDNIGSGVSGC
jgi:hypothetical protein